MLLLLLFDRQVATVTGAEESSSIGAYLHGGNALADLLQASCHLQAQHAHNRWSAIVLSLQCSAPGSLLRIKLLL